ncbi:FAD:protein FMN transferase [bacterium]|nr:FAD:protein FMN transferase [bacterium]
MKRRWIAAGCFAALALFVVTAFGASRQVRTEPERLEFVETHMGARVRILLYTTEPQVAKRAVEAAFARIAELDKSFSDYDNGSELMRLVNHFAEGPAEPVEVSQDLFDILTRAESISRSTGGAFDVTAAPLIRQWRRAFREKKLPSADNLAKAREQVGFERIRRIEPGRKIALEPGTRIDLGGIAKGYAAAAALQVLRKLGVESALVAVAGDIALGSPPPGQKGWAVEVAGLNPNSDLPLVRLRLRDATISTSGDAERFVEIDGRRYSHIVDPRTGFGVTRRATVTVISQDGSATDAYATSLYLLGVNGPELTGKLRNAPPLAVSWLELTGDRHAEQRTNRAFDTLPRE